MCYTKNRIVKPRLGSKWLCIKKFPSDDDSCVMGYRKGEVYESKSYGTITDDFGNEFYWTNVNDDGCHRMFDLFKHFKLIPRNKRCTIKNLS